MRRGPGGGLVVAAPDLDAMVRAVSLQLHHERISPDQVLEARRSLEALDTLVKSGKVRFIGCSNLAAWHIIGIVHQPA